MAHAVSSPPMLKLARSAQSGAKAMTAAWQAVYSGSSVMAYIFAGGVVDLSTMDVGDIVEIRIRKVVVSGGNWISHHQVTYRDARPADQQAVYISAIPDIYGVEIAMRQPAGTLRTFNCEFLDAKRIGLE